MNNYTAIVDNGGANIASLLYAFERLQARAVVTTDATLIQSAPRVLLPGVGAAADAMQRLREHRLVDVIRKLTQPVLGICLGMQLLAEASEEENVECLGVLPGVAKRLAESPSTAVPNMGWCAIAERVPHPVLSGIDVGEYFYFLHSYALPLTEHTIATATHTEEFAAVISKDNFVAAQFHPERSSSAGARILQNFVESNS